MNLVFEYEIFLYAFLGTCLVSDMLLLYLALIFVDIVSFLWLGKLI